ncbi:contractile injection system tape measure protein [Tenacibaculum ovolyticum]|uniref:contractile injection system tape measure protein n=1 Tax=Tenacibaculum ovolyticum TaxID=104270 RepID=UPI001EEF7495|nr:contractile injection system tape measure protein [Tenacibaculum ovolyticum]
MITGEEHTINKVFVEVNTKSKKVAEEYKNSIETFLKEEVFPQIEKYFNSLKLSSEEVIQQISKLTLEVNLSNRNSVLNFKTAQQEVKQQILEQLKIVLDKPTAHDVKVNSLTVSKSNLNTFFYFLENGTLPWWSNIDDKAVFSRKILFEITENENFETQFLKVIRNNKIKQRLINQFFDDELQLLFLGILNKPKGLKEILSIISNTKIESEEKRKNIWLYVIKGVLVKDFFKVITTIKKESIQLTAKNKLNKESTKFKEEYTQLQEKISTSVQNYKGESKLEYILELFYEALPELKEKVENEKRIFVSSSKNKLREKAGEKNIFQKGKDINIPKNITEEKETFLKKNKQDSIKEQEDNFSKKQEYLGLKTAQKSLERKDSQKVNEKILTTEELEDVKNNIREEKEVHDLVKQELEKETENKLTDSESKEDSIEKEELRITKEKKTEETNNKKLNTRADKLSKENVFQNQIIKTNKEELGNKFTNEKSEDNEPYVVAKDVKIHSEKSDKEVLERENEISKDNISLKNIAKRTKGLDENRFLKNNKERELIVDNRINIKESFNELNSQITKNKTGVVNQNTSYFVDNAGLILIHPFLKQFFNSCNFLNEENKIIKPIQAVHLLHYVATKREKQVESNLVFEKFLCNVPINHSIPRNISLSAELKEKAEELLKAVTQNWEVLKKSSPDLIRNEFIQRAGKLDLTKDNPSITIERKAQDILLDKLPWNYSMCKLPWMDILIFTNW